MKIIFVTVLMQKRIQRCGVNAKTIVNLMALITSEIGWTTFLRVLPQVSKSNYKIDSY